MTKFYQLSVNEMKKQGLELYTAYRCPECMRNIESMRKKDEFYQCQCGEELQKGDMIEKIEERRSF